MSALPSFKENISQATPFSGCFHHEAIKLHASTYSLSTTQNNTQSKFCSIFKYSPNEKDIVYGPNGI